MPEFTLEQTALYLEHLVSSKGSSSVSSLSASQVEQIHSESSGSPGLIKELAKGLVEPAKKVAETTGQNSSISVSTIIGGGVVILVALLILIFQDDINVIFSGEEETVELISEELIETEEKSLAIPEYEEMAKTEPIDHMVQGGEENIEGLESDLGPVTKENEEKIAKEIEGAVGEQQEQKLQPEADQDQTKQLPVDSEPVIETEQIKKEEVSATETSQPSEDKEGAKAESAEKVEVESASVEKETAKKSGSPEKQPAKILNKKEKVQK
jgi:hypothetical protein